MSRITDWADELAAAKAALAVHRDRQPQDDAWSRERIVLVRALDLAESSVRRLYRARRDGLHAYLCNGQLDPASRAEAEGWLAAWEEREAWDPADLAFWDRGRDWILATRVPPPLPEPRPLLPIHPPPVSTTPEEAERELLELTDWPWTVTLRRHVHLFTDEVQWLCKVEYDGLDVELSAATPEAAVRAATEAALHIHEIDLDFRREGPSWLWMYPDQYGLKVS